MPAALRAVPVFLQPPHYPEPVYSHLKGLPAMLQMPSDMWCLPDYNRFVPDYTVHSDLRAAAGTAEESPSCMYKVRPDIYSGFPPVSLPLPGLLPELPAAVPEPGLLPVRTPELPLHAVPLLQPLRSVISETRHKPFYPLFSSQAPEHSFWHPSASSLLCQIYFLYPLYHTLLISDSILLSDYLSPDPLY